MARSPKCRRTRTLMGHAEADVQRCPQTPDPVTTQANGAGRPVVFDQTGLPHRGHFSTARPGEKRSPLPPDTNGPWRRLVTLSPSWPAPPGPPPPPPPPIFSPPTTAPPPAWSTPQLHR